MPTRLTPIESTPFGRYQLLKKIATGGMAEIFLAKQQGPGRFERRLIIKRILPHLAQDPKFVGMFLDEAALSAQLSHPNIAQVYDFGEEEGHYYLALELVRGPDLGRVISACREVGAPPPLDLALRLVSQILAALDYAHHALDDKGQPLNLVHRDISPQNVLVSFDGVVKVIDFGIAKAASATQKTEAGIIKGKFSYMAPEQLRAQPLDGRCDLYATALVLYELLALEPALKGEGPAAIGDALDARFRPLAELRPDVPAAILHTIERALQRDREARQHDCREIQEELDAALVARGVTVTPHEIGRFLKGLQDACGTPLSSVGWESSGAAFEATAIRPSDPLLDVAAPEAKAAASAPAVAAPAKSPAPPPAEAQTVLRPTGSAAPVRHAEPLPNKEEDGSAGRRAEAEGPKHSIDGAAFASPRRRVGPRGAVVAGLLLAVAVIAVWASRHERDSSPPSAPLVAALPPLSPQPVVPEEAPRPAPTTAVIPLPALPEPAVASAAAKAPTAARAALQPSRERRRATLTVDCSPPAELFVDGRDLGATPVADVALAAGQHTMKVASAELGFSRSLTLRLSPGEAHREALHFGKGKLILFVKPWANVTVAGRSLGQTPLPPQTFYEGSYAVRFENPALHRVVERRVTIQPGQPTLVKVDFTQG